MRPRLRRSSTGTVRWCSGYAGGCSATRATLKTPFRRHSWYLCVPGGRSGIGALFRHGFTAWRFESRGTARAQTLRRANYEVAVVGLDVATKPDANEMLKVGPVLDHELSRLPEKYRAPLVLCYLEGRTHDQAAEALRCPVGTVRSRLARGRDLLKKRLTRGGYSPTATLLTVNQPATLRLLSESVPPSLATQTLKLVLRSGASKSIRAGASAASVLALTQGVVTTMKLSRIKWIGLSLLATGLSAGGAVAVSYARPGGSHVGLNKGLATADVISLAKAPELQTRADLPSS